MQGDRYKNFVRDKKLPEAFTTDLFSILLQQGFHFFSIDRLNFYPFIVTSTIRWDRKLVASLNVSSLDIYFRFFTDFNHGILKIFIKDAVQYAW